MDAQAEAQLQTAVDQDPRDLGQSFSLWTCLDLAMYLVAPGLAPVSAETVRRHLHQLGYRGLRPVLSVSSPDPEYEAKVKHLAECPEQARQGKLVLLYQDEFDLNLLPGVLRCWTRRGEQGKVPTPGQNVKRYGFGAVNFLSGQLTYGFGERKNSEGFCALVEQIVQEYCPGESYTGPKVAMVVDNYIIHRSKKSKGMLEKYTDRLLVVPLPSYAPKLNVIERLWKHLRRKVTHNHLFESIEKLVEAADQFFQSLDRCRIQVLSIIGSSG